jgi:PEP-CTERM motif
MRCFILQKCRLPSCVILFCVAVAVHATNNQARADLTFSFGAGTGNPSADLGFQLAANFLSSKFSDNLTVTIDSGFSALAPGVLGQAGSTLQNFNFSTFRTAAVSDVTSLNDAIYTSNLPVGSFSMYMNRTSNNGNSAVPYVDNTGANTTSIQLTTANARALGMTGFAGTDAQITFSSLFTWDFDNTDGITPGAIDFVGVAIHELMHAMGFVSNVDDVDSSPNLSDDSYFPTPLDFTRQSADSLAAGARIDFTADARAKYFSLDGGATNLTPGPNGGFSTGFAFGDGRQASHWKDNLGLGIMDPTAQPAGIANVVTDLDLQALDAIGWNLQAVPEPSSLLLVGMYSLVVGLTRRKTKIAPKF